MWTVTIDGTRRRFTDEELRSGAALEWVSEQAGEDMFPPPRLHNASHD